MKRMRNILICCMALLAFLSCEKGGPSTVAPADRITFAPYIPQTKGFIENISSLGHTMVVYDWMTKDNDTGWYMDGVSIECDADGNWNYSGDYTGKEFLWMDQTYHQFFGWLTKDASMTENNTPESFFGEDFGFSDWILTIPTKKMTPTTPQFDFMYSGVSQRQYSKNGGNTPTGAGGGDSSPIDLEMKHLFTAFRFYIENLRNVNITIKNISLTNIYTQKSATVDFRNPSEVSYADKVKETLENNSIGVLKTSDPRINIFSQNDDYFMVWPQTSVEFADAEIVISYRQEGQDLVKRFKLNELTHTEWAGGSRYSYNIVFTDKEVKLICTVNPWQTEDEVIDFTENISISKKMSWEESSLKEVGGHKVENAEVILKDNKEPAICRFQIDAPVGATWYASLISIDGHTDAFEFDGNNYGKVGVPAELRIKVTNNAPHAPTHKAKLRIVVVVGDRTIVVNDLIESTTQHEYTIIQNRIG